MNPIRIQRKRTKGWRMPPNTVYVGRPTKYGNRFRIDPNTSREMAVGLYELYMCGWEKREARDELKGKNLACWCPLDKPCHVDILLKIANE